MWKPVGTFVAVFGLAVLLLGLTPLDAVQGAAAAFFVATGAAALAAGWRRRS